MPIAPDRRSTRLSGEKSRPLIRARKLARIAAMKPHHIRWVLIVMLLVMVLSMVLGRAAEIPVSALC